MTQEEKDLLLKDISARLPYGVKSQVLGWNEETKKEVYIPLKIYSVNTDGYVYFEPNDYDVNYCRIDNCKLYLRQMSSMTNEEKQKLQENVVYVNKEGRTVVRSVNYIDYLYSQHYDIHGLIPMGLAFEALEGMYDTKTE